jgi:hypothetical protein
MHIPGHNRQALDDRQIPLLTLIQAGDAAVDFRDKMASAWAQPWLGRVDQAIEPVFFDHLFARAEQGRAADQAWALFLKTIADRIFQRAASAVPIAGARRLKIDGMYGAAGRRWLATRIDGVVIPAAKAATLPAVASDVATAIRGDG